MTAFVTARRSLSLVALASGLALSLSGRIPQPARYHDLADKRVVLGIPNGLDVLSNLPFAIVGVAGLVVTFRRASRSPVDDPWLRWPYATVFAGGVLTALGSAYYHLAPDDFRLFWDRLPMTFAFTGLLCAVVAERMSVPLARAIFGPLLALGASSVALWYWSERLGAGDLRLYVLVQFGSLLSIVVLLPFDPARRGGTRWLAAGLVAYAAAKVLELADRPIFALGRLVSGHTLKHLAAAAGLACVAAMLGARGSPGARPDGRDLGADPPVESRRGGH